MKTVLIVCTGNLCRSPMATVILTQRLADQGLADQVRVESAGTYTRAGGPASGPARALMTERGLSLEEHRSRPVTEAMLRAANLVLVMEENHRRFLFHLSMNELHKVLLLSELSGGHDDVKDPYGGTREDYIKALGELETLIDAGMPRILRYLKLPQMDTPTK